MERARGSGIEASTENDSAESHLAQEAVERFEASSVSESLRTRKRSKGKRPFRKGENWDSRGKKSVKVHWNSQKYE